MPILMATLLRWRTHSARTKSFNLFSLNFISQNNFVLHINIQNCFNYNIIMLCAVWTGIPLSVVCCQLSWERGLRLISVLDRISYD